MSENANKSSKKNVSTFIVAAIAGSLIYNTTGFGSTDNQSVIWVSCIVIAAFSAIGFLRSILD